MSNKLCGQWLIILPRELENYEMSISTGFVIIAATYLTVILHLQDGTFPT